MKNTIILIVCLLFCFLSASCFVKQGSGNIITEERPVPSFTGVKLNGIGEVFLFQAHMSSVEIKTDDNIINYITTEVREGILEISVSPGKALSPTKVEVFIVNNVYDHIESAGSGNIWGKGLLYGAIIQVRLSGSGNITFRGESKKIDAILSGSGTMTIEGYALRFNADLSGSGKIDALQCTANKGTINLSGSGECSLFAREDLNINLSGSGKVYYRGNPVIDSSVTGSGAVINTRDR